MISALSAFLVGRNPVLFLWLAETYKRAELHRIRVFNLILVIYYLIQVKEVASAHKDQRSQQYDIVMVSPPQPVKSWFSTKAVFEGAVLAFEADNPKVLLLPGSHCMFPFQRDMDKGHLENLRVMIEADPLQTLHEQEKELIWRLRYECQYHFPHCLARLLLCIQWNDHVHVALMQDLLLMWPQLKTQYALELLDCNYADRAVRKFAVKCLHEIR